MNNMDKFDTIGVPFRIGLLLFEGFALMSYASLIEPLRAANLLGEREIFRVYDLSVTGSVAESSSGATIRTKVYSEAGIEFDLVLAVAGGDPTEFNNPGVVAWLRALDRHGVILGGVSGGPAILALGGLMNGRRMTVHWEHAPVLEELAPEILLERALFVIERDRITCAGGTAPLDLMHTLIARIQGPELAGLVSDWFLHTEVRRSTGQQRTGMAERYGTRNGAVLRSLEIMENHSSDLLTLGQIARLTGAGPRQLNRLFRRELGESTMACYRRIRLQLAHSMLRSAGLSISDVALATGFAGASHFSRAFRAQFGEPPSKFREK